MNSMNEFSERDWALAPRYESATTLPGVVAIEFEAIKSIALEEEAGGSFRKTQDGSFGKAPLYVDGMPAALYALETKQADDFSPNHNTAEDEILVIVDGALRLTFNYGEDRPKANNLANTYCAGRVLRLRDESVSMQAIGVFSPASALALALFRDDDSKIQYTM